MDIFRFLVSNTFLVEIFEKKNRQLNNGTTELFFIPLRIECPLNAREFSSNFILTCLKIIGQKKFTISFQKKEKLRKTDVWSTFNSDLKKKEFCRERFHQATQFIQFFVIHEFWMYAVPTKTITVLQTQGASNMKQAFERWKCYLQQAI